MRQHWNCIVNNTTVFSFLKVMKEKLAYFVCKIISIKAVRPIITYRL